MPTTVCPSCGATQEGDRYRCYICDAVLETTSRQREGKREGTMVAGARDNSETLHKGREKLEDPIADKTTEEQPETKEAYPTQADIPFAVSLKNRIHKRGDVGNFTLVYTNVSHECIRALECKLESHSLVLQREHLRINRFDAETNRPESFPFDATKYGGFVLVDAHFRCVDAKGKSSYYRGQFEVHVASNSNAGEDHRQYHYYTWENTRAQYLIKRDQKHFSAPPEGAEPEAGGNRVKAESEWLEIRLLPDDEAAQKAAEKRASRKESPVVGTALPAGPLVRDIHYALLTSQDAGRRETVTICSRPRIPFGRDHEGRHPSTLLWPPRITPPNARNEWLYQHISRLHGEFVLDSRGISVSVPDKCIHGLVVNEHRIRFPDIGPQAIENGDIVEFPEAKIRYRARILRPHTETRERRLRSLASLDPHATRRPYESPGARSGLMGMEGNANFDAICFCPQGTDDPEGRPTTRESLVILVREAWIGSSAENAIVVDGPGLGRVHAKIILMKGKYWLQHLGDATTTRLGAPNRDPESDLSLKMGESVELFDGARITLGESVFSFIMRTH